MFLVNTVSPVKHLFRVLRTSSADLNNVAIRHENGVKYLPRMCITIGFIIIILDTNIVDYRFRNRRWNYWKKEEKLKKRKNAITKKELTKNIKS